MSIDRRVTRTAALADTSVSTSETINLANFAGGRYLVPDNGATGGITQISWYESLDGGTTWVVANDDSAAALDVAVTEGQSYPIPASLFGSEYIRAVATGATGTLQLVLKP